MKRYVQHEPKGGPAHRAMWGLGIGAVSGAVIGAGRFTLATFVFGRGIGILGNSLSLSALVGVVFIGLSGGIVGAIIGISNTTILRSAIIGLVIGLIITFHDVYGSERHYFYESGYFDRQLFFSDIIHWSTLLFGHLFIGAVVAAFLRRGYGKNR